MIPRDQRIHVIISNPPSHHYKFCSNIFYFHIFDTDPVFLDGCYATAAFSEKMTRVSYLNVLGTVIVFGSVPSGAFVRYECFHVVVKPNDASGLSTGQSRKRTLPFRRSDDVLLSRERYHLSRKTPFQSKLQESESDPSFDDLLKFELLSSISTVPEEDWNRCLCSHSSPFMEHSWLRCLEEAGCATVEAGWLPSHVLIRMGNQICGFVPVRVEITATHG